ncbi:MAG: N-acetyltransferase [Dehalococcoidia bacterium]|nr:N-acetyltransferase [Dehalococcoidia bacterium]
MVRPGTLADLEQALALERAGFEGVDAYNRRQFRHLLSPHINGVVLVDDVDGELRGLGTLLWRKNACAGRIYDLVVHPAHRGKGIGKALLLAAEAHAEKRRLPTLHVEVRANNVPARTLYESIGFALLKDLKDYYGEGEHGLHLRKSIAGHP